MESEETQREMTLEDRIEHWLERCYHPNDNRSALEKNTEAYKLLSEVIKERREKK